MPRIKLAMAQKVNGRNYKPGSHVNVDQATASNLIHLGLARLADTSKAHRAEQAVEQPEAQSTANSQTDETIGKED